jgi:hypothetical protein
MPVTGWPPLAVISVRPGQAGSRPARAVAAVTLVRMPIASGALAAAFAPEGRLRASINAGNPVLAHRDAVTGEAGGVSVDLARALGRDWALRSS